MRSTTFRVAAHCLAALTTALALSACTGDQRAAAPGTPAIDAAGTNPGGITQWCDAYGAIAANMAALRQTPEDAASGVGLLVTFDRLWLSAGQLGLVTPEEVEANRAAGRGYSGIMQMVADGAGEEEIRSGPGQVHSVDRADAGATDLVVGEDQRGVPVGSLGLRWAVALRARPELTLGRVKRTLEAHGRFHRSAAVRALWYFEDV